MFTERWRHRAQFGTPWEDSTTAGKILVTLLGGSLYWKCSFGEVYHRLYGRKFRFTQCVSGDVKRNFQPYNRRYASPNEHFEYGYPHSNALFNICLSKAQHFAPNWSFVSNVKQVRQPIKSDINYDVGAPTVYRRIYWRKFLMLSNRTSRYIRKCIRSKISLIEKGEKAVEFWTAMLYSYQSHFTKVKGQFL